MHPSKKEFMMRKLILVAVAAATAMPLAATSTHTSKYPYWAPAVRFAATLPGST